MTKKTLLAGAIVAGMLTAVNVGAPVNLEKFPLAKPMPIVLENALERFAKENEVRLEKIKGKMHRIEEEHKLLKSDEIYMQINSIYNKSGLNIPKYMTKRFLREIVKLESTDYPKAIGKAGERGLTQMTKGAWYEVEKENFEKNAFIPKKNITASIKYFLLIDNFCRKKYPNWQELPDAEKIKILVASYNGGKENLWKLNWNISEMKPITQNYVKNIEGIIDSILPY